MLSCTVAPKVLRPSPVGVPLIAPAAVIVSPAGSYNPFVQRIVTYL
jgi:hypothetical protein